MAHWLNRLSRVLFRDADKIGVVDPRFQVMIMIASNVLISGVFVYPIYKYCAYEKLPEIVSVEHTSGRQEIRIGMHIENFLESNLVKNDFGFEGVLWFSYPEGACTPEQLEPFTIQQGSISAKKLIRNEVHNGRATTSYSVQGTFRVPMDFRGFPLDDHLLYIIIKHETLDPEQYYLATSADCFTLSSQAEINNCVIQSSCAYAGHRIISLAGSCSGVRAIEIKEHQALFEFNCRRQDLRHFANVWLPLVLIFFLAIFAFSFAPDTHGTDVPAIAAAGVPALLAYRFVIESLSPDVNYFMLSDYLFFLFLLLCLFIFYGVAWGYGKTIGVKKTLILLLYGVMVIGSTVLVWIMNV